MMLDEIQEGMPVLYMPRHAQGKRTHPDCQRGIITGKTATHVLVRSGTDRQSNATNPAFLLLDEPAAGLNESESDELIGAIGAIRDEFGCGVLVIEHDMRLIMRLCERIQVLDYGKTICIGTPVEVQADPGVVTAYLGVTREPRQRTGRADDAPG